MGINVRFLDIPGFAGNSVAFGEREGGMQNGKPVQARGETFHPRPWLIFNPSADTPKVDRAVLFTGCGKEHGGFSAIATIPPHRSRPADRRALTAFFFMAGRP